MDLLAPNYRYFAAEYTACQPGEDCNTHSEEAYVYTGVQNLVREFVDCCKNHTQPQTNFSDAVKTMEIAEKILAQALLEGV